MSDLRSALESALDESVNIVNAELLARERGIEITETTSNESSDFNTMVQAVVQTDHGELTASGTIFGNSTPTPIIFAGL